MPAKENAVPKRQPAIPTAENVHKLPTLAANENESDTRVLWHLPDLPPAVSRDSWGGAFNMAGSDTTCSVSHGLRSGKHGETRVKQAVNTVLG